MALFLWMQPSIQPIKPALQHLSNELLEFTQNILMNIPPFFKADEGPTPVSKLFSMKKDFLLIIDDLLHIGFVSPVEITY